MSKQMLIFHMLRNYAPSNLNRDERGAPKDCQFGGVRRGRISSQSLKRAIRMSEPFDVFRDAGMIDIRTRSLPLLVSDDLLRRGIAQADITEIVGRLHELGRKEKAATDEEKEEKKSKADKAPELTTKQLVRCAPATIAKLCDQLLELKQSSTWKKRLDEIIQTVDVYGVDTALFGAMTTSAAFSDVNSACQVGHAISTNETAWRTDYFTAVDDITNETAMIGESPYNSNCYYWAFAVNVDILLHNLQGDKEVAKRVLHALVEAMFTAHPGGKQNTFFAQPPVSLFLAEKRHAVAMDYANAFESPISPVDKVSLLKGSVNALAAYVPTVDSMYQLPVERRHVSLFNVEFPQSSQVISWEDLADWVSLTI